MIKILQDLNFYLEINSKKDEYGIGEDIYQYTRYGNEKGRGIMDIKIKKSSFEQVQEKLINNSKNINPPFDSFLEDHILKSEHFEVLLDSKRIGYFSIFKKHLLTQFYLDKSFRYLAQDIFNKVKKYQYVEKAFVSTSDEFFLSHAIDYLRRIELQAYFFQDSNVVINEEKTLSDFYLKIAKKEDIELIIEKSGDFFDDVERQVKNQELFIGYLKDQVVSFGIIEKSKLYEKTASIGMFTDPEHRGKGIGRNTLLKLKEICYENDITPIAGCWYYNHNSKKTLESAGMFSQTRLLDIHF